MIEKLEGEGLGEETEALSPSRELEALQEPASRFPAAGGRGPASSPAEEPEPEAPASIVPLEPGELRGALEAVFFATSEPLTIRSISDLFQVPVHDVREAVEELRLEYIDQSRAFRLEDIAGGMQILTLSKFDPWIRRLRQKEKETRLSGAALETLSVIAYKQPIGKADLEAIRGVGCGPILKTLLERGLIQIAGRGEGLGKPLLYGTTKRFLESFGIASVRDLPQPEIGERIKAVDAAPDVLAPPAPALAPPAEVAGELAGPKDSPAAPDESAPAVTPASEDMSSPGGPLS